MFERDYDTFASLLDDVSELRQIPVLSARAKALFFRAVERYTIDQVRGAIEAHLIDPEAGKFKTHIQPAHIVAQIEGAAANDGRPGADEAWAIALEACDEAATVVWTEETARSLAAAQAVLDIGDKVGARMAFKNAYERLVTQARAERRPMRWQYSLGHDPRQREQALQNAVTNGLLPAPQVAALLPPPEGMSQTDTETARQNTQRLMAMLTGAISPAEKMRRAREQAALTEQNRLTRLKARSEEKAGTPAADIWPMSDLKQVSHELR